MENYGIPYIHDFDDFNLKSDLLRGIYSYGYERPSDIQRKAIIPILQGFDLLAQGQSGTGKSAAFIIPVLQIIDEDLHECQAIILVPTLDLAQQVSHLMKRLAEFLKISISICDKSASSDDIEGMQILIGTPKTILKMLNLGSLKMSTLKIIAVDGADKLVPEEETREILGSRNETIQVVMVSLTMTEEMLMIAKKYTRDPVMILIPKEKLMLERFRHFYILVDKNELKIDILVELLQEAVGIVQALIYCNEKETVNEVAETLSKKSLTCSKIKDDEKEFPDREAEMKKFRTGGTRILVTTDVLPRGVEMKKVSIIFNYDLPLAKEEYVHRIERCNRLTRGYAINFVIQDEVERLKELEKYHGIIFDCYTDYFS